MSVLCAGVLALAFTQAGCTSHLSRSRYRPLTTELGGALGGPGRGLDVYASRTESDTAAGPRRTAGHGAADHEEEHAHRHHVALFLGNTRAEGEDKPTVGVDYEYRLTRAFGVGGLVDHARGDHNATIVGGALFVHPWGDWRLLLAPGIEHAAGHNEFLVRSGVSHDFHLGRLTVSPTLNVDFVAGEVSEVCGVSVGYGF